MLLDVTPIKPYVSSVYTERLSEIRSEIAQLRSELRDSVNAHNLMSSCTGLLDWICGTNMSGDVYDTFLGWRYEEKRARLERLEHEERYLAPLAEREACAIAQAEAETRRRQDEEKRKEEFRKIEAARRKEAEAQQEKDAQSKEADGCQQKKARQKPKVKKPKAKSKKSVTLVAGCNGRLQMLKGKKVYVDGSSLAFWSKELGPRVLPLLMTALQRAGLDAYFVFDANIRDRLEASGDASGREHLDQLAGEWPSRVTTIPDGLGVADYILPLADKNFGVILSNDTYTQYEKRYSWLKCKGTKDRLLKVEFVDGELLVPAIGVSVSGAGANKTSCVDKNDGKGKKRKHKGAKGQHRKGAKGQHGCEGADKRRQKWHDDAYDDWYSSWDDDDDDDYYRRRREEEDERRREEEERRREEEEEDERRREEEEEEDRRREEWW